MSGKDKVEFPQGSREDRDSLCREDHVAILQLTPEVGRTMVKAPRHLLTLVAVLMATVILGTSACISQPNQEETLEVVYESQLEAEITALNRDPDRSSALLRDLTDWEWDRVSVFYEGDLSSLVIAEVGSLGRITSEERVFATRGSLFVFQLDGEVVKIIATLHIWVFPDASDRRSYTGDVELVPYPSGGGLELRDVNSPPR